MNLMRIPHLSQHIFWTLCIIAVFSLSGCKKDECEGIVCNPCPSSRLQIQYQDAGGKCVPSFHASAMVYGFNGTNTSDTIRRYNLSDSCRVVILVQEDLTYHIVSGTIRDTVHMETFEYQEPVEVTECCLCYPVSHVHIKFNGVVKEIEWPAGQFENVPWIREL